MILLRRLRQIRERAALTQAELASKAGVTRVSVLRIEGGQPARPSTTRRLARALGVKPSELMDAEEEKK
jgi:transcriptional regulator with XRE-family HTH domain